jgi:hypothetical protein
MLAPKFQSQLESQGGRVIYANVFVHDDGNEIHGLDSNGEPEIKPTVDCNGKPITPTVIISVHTVGKFYFGNNIETVKTKLQAKMPDIIKEKQNETISVSVIGH